MVQAVIALPTGMLKLLSSCQHHGLYSGLYHTRQAQYVLVDEYAIVYFTSETLKG
jgi:hypothetical protein